MTTVQYNVKEKQKQTKKREPKERLVSGKVCYNLVSSSVTLTSWKAVLYSTPLELADYVLGIFHVTATSQMTVTSNIQVSTN